MDKWNTLAPAELLDETIKNLKANGFKVIVTENALEAKDKILELIPEKTEVMTMSSETLRTTGIADAINNSPKFNSVRNKLNKMDRATQNREMQKLGAAPEYAVGSVHAVTSDGHVLIASNTGSQLPAYAYGSEHVIWVVGTQKIVKDNEEGIKRIYEYILPKESVRLAKQYQRPDLKSNVSKLLIVNKEFNPNRITIVLVKEELGF
jgi:hypothetical protein